LIAEFQCTRCGKCCKEHRNPMLGQIHGLMLLPTEIHLFPKDLIKPMFRYHPNSRPELAEVVWMYQLDSDGCPHYDEENRSCKIYEKRPMICRAFPFEWRGNDMISHESCPEIERLKKLNSQVRIPRMYVYAAAKIQQHQHNYMMKESNVERYDLETRSWHSLFKGMTKDHFRWLAESRK